MPFVVKKNGNRWVIQNDGKTYKTKYKSAVSAKNKILVMQAFIKRRQKR